MQFLLGLIIVVVGFYMVAKTNSVLSFFGRIAFFDKYLGTEGGSRLGYKLIGCFVIFIGTLIMTDMIDVFMEWLVSPLTNKM